MSILEKIRNKVRRVTGRVSETQITDGQIDEYVKDFFAYDFPRSIKPDFLNSTFEFMTEANVDLYKLSENDAKNLYYDFRPPVYIAGRKAEWFQNRDSFFHFYGITVQDTKTLQGNDTVGAFSLSFFEAPLLQNKVTVSAIDNAGGFQNYIDSPTDREKGVFRKIEDKTQTMGEINYLTGEIKVTFPKAIPKKQKIYFSAIRYFPNEPKAVLLSNDSLTLRPVPDRAYLVSITADKNPETFANFPTPLLNQWWQYLALGACKKIFEDVQDDEGVARIQNSFKEQEVLVMRRTINQNRTQEAITPYFSTFGRYYWY